MLHDLNTFVSTASDICCSMFGFFDSSTKQCVSDLEIKDFDSNCLQWDRKNMRCFGCKTGFYLTNGGCC